MSRYVCQGVCFLAALSSSFFEILDLVFGPLGTLLVINSTSFAFGNDMLNEKAEPVYVQELHNHKEDEVGNANTKFIWHRAILLIGVECVLPNVVYQNW